MKDDLREWFKECRDRYAGAKRLAFILVSILLVGHLTTFSQYVRTRSSLNAAEKKTTALLTAEEQFLQIKTSVEDLNHFATQHVAQALATFVQTLVEDFGVLNKNIKIARGEIDADASAENRMFQGVQEDREEFELPAALQEKLKGADDMREIRKLLLPWVNENVINSRFTELQQSWSNKLLTRFDSQVTGIKELLAKVAPESGADPVLLVRFHESLDKTVSAARGIQFTAPKNDDWWFNIERKRATADYIRESAVESLELAESLESARALAAFAEQSRRSAEVLENALKKALAAQEDTFQKQREKAEALARPLSFLTLDLDYVSENFPLVIGFGFAIAILWPAWRKRELAHSCRLLAREDPQASIWAEVLGLNRSNRTREFSFAILAVVSISCAAWQLTHFEILVPGTAIRLAAIASIAVFGSVVYSSWSHDETKLAPLAQKKAEAAKDDSVSSNRY